MPGIPSTQPFPALGPEGGEAHLNQGGYADPEQPPRPLRGSIHLNHPSTDPAPSRLRVANGDPRRDSAPDLGLDRRGSPSPPPPPAEPASAVLSPGAGFDPLDEAHPLQSPARPLLQRLRYRSRAFMHRHSAAAPKFAAASTESRAPTFVKTYPSHPKLPVDVYIPPPDASRPGPLPLYVHVAPVSFLKPHAAPRGRRRGGGGGKRARNGGSQSSGAGSPPAEGGPPLTAADLVCSRLSRRHGVCVASVTWRCPPRWMFPTQLWDVAGLVQEIVAGTGLPIDRGRVAVGGVGAGASVALGVAQAAPLQGVVKAVAAVAPVVDWSVPFAAKAAGEPADPEAARLYDLMDWSYVPPRFDRADAMLSPAYAAQGKLPPNVFLAGIDGDILCPEAERLAARLAAERGPGAAAAQGRSWERAGVRWERVVGWPQSFFELVAKAGKEGEQKALEPLVDELGDWLWRTAYA